MSTLFGNGGVLIWNDVTDEGRVRFYDDVAIHSLEIYRLAGPAAGP